MTYSELVKKALKEKKLTATAFCLKYNIHHSAFSEGLSDMRSLPLYIREIIEKELGVKSSIYDVENNIKESTGRRTYRISHKIKR